MSHCNLINLKLLVISLFDKNGIERFLFSGLGYFEHSIKDSKATILIKSKSKRNLKINGRPVGGGSAA